jgi:hypothetical protein
MGDGGTNTDRWYKLAASILHPELGRPVEPTAPKGANADDLSCAAPASTSARLFLLEPKLAARPSPPGEAAVSSECCWRCRQPLTDGRCLACRERARDDFDNGVGAA